MLLKKTCIWSNNSSKNVHLKVFWTLFKNVHCRGPCSLRPCISRPYCNEVWSFLEKLLSFDNWHNDRPLKLHTFVEKPKIAPVWFSSKVVIRIKNVLCCIFELLAEFFFATTRRFICTSPRWLWSTSSSSQCRWTRMPAQMIECYQFNCHFAVPQKR